MNKIKFPSRKEAIEKNLRWYVGGYCKNCKQPKVIRYTCNSVCVNCSNKGGK